MGIELLLPSFLLVSRLPTPESYLGCMSALYCLDALPSARSLARDRPARDCYAVYLCD